MFGKAKITKTINIEGMSCMHCAGRVESALKALKGVSDATVNLDEKTAVVKLKDNIENDALKNAVEDAGYTVTGIE